MQFDNARNCHHLRHRVARAPHGLTLIELLVSISIMVVIAVAFTSGLIRYQTRYKVTTGVTRIESALHYARNLAIANNTVYHVRFENVITAAADGTVNKPSREQVVGIYCFPEMARAMTVTSEAGPSGAPVIWNPFPSMKKRTVVAGGTVTAENSGGTADHDNYLVEKVILSDGAYFGFQYLSTMPSPPYDSVLYFSPDGTMYFSPDGGTTRTSATIFVTDNSEYADDRTMAPDAYATLQENRRIFYNTKKPPVVTDRNKQLGLVRMIQVYGGGMIKQLPPGSSL